MLHSVNRHPNPKRDDTLVLEGSADELIGIEAGEGDTEFDSVAGFTVVRTAPGKHDGYPAVTAVLADEMGGREIGRITVRTDAMHDEILTWERCFPGDPEKAEAFLKSFETHTVIPAGWRAMKARQLEVGMTMADPDLFPETVMVESVHLRAREDDGPFGPETLPSGIGVFVDAYGDPFDSEDTVWVRAS